MAASFSNTREINCTQLLPEEAEVHLIFTEAEVEVSRKVKVEVLTQLYYWSNKVRVLKV